MYGRGNPMRYTDPTGHCATLDNGNEDWQGDKDCWTLAYQIYGHGLTEQQFTEDWRVSADTWLENIAKAQYADVNYLTPFLNKYVAAFNNRTGLNRGVPNPVTSGSSSFQIGISINPDAHEFLMMGLKAGTVAGPIMMESGALMCGTVILCTSGVVVEVGGMMYTVVGYTTVAVDDIILPFVNLDFRALAENGINEGIDTAVEHGLERNGFEQIAPWTGPVHDTIDALNVDVCVGNKC
jgi:hypothetical protein